ncbi:zinc finger MYM-type protein 1-like [Macrobrachium rosenbergii]|uniref:zinc finger MYM-type protein 1-like n=1 Tax=Macrobrachium rosenbergii TaxID=79674 RepID=UPI0034D61643
MKTRLKANNKVKYTSPKIQNEIFGLLAQMIREEISEELSSNTYFSVMIDESRDISKKEQLSAVVRCVYKNNIHEEFLDFVWLHNLNAKSLKDSLCTVLRLCLIDPRNCVGQTYDGASVMSGVNRGVQQLVREELTPQAVYIHCYNHRLNLIIVDCVRSVRLADFL